MGKMSFTDVSNVEITPEAKKVLEEVYNSVEEGEEFFRETQKSKVLKEHEDKKEKNMEKLMSNAGISYKDLLKNIEG